MAEQSHTSTPPELSVEHLQTLLSAGARVYIQGGSVAPEGLLNFIETADLTAREVEYVSVSIPGVNNFNPCALHEGARFRTFFMHDGIQGERSTIDFMPLHYRAIYDYLETSAPFDVALFQLSPPDANGQCSLGTAIDFAPAVLQKARKIVAQINPCLPAKEGMPMIPYAAIDYVLTQAQTFSYSNTQKHSPVAERIAQHVASLIGDGDCIQIGIGKLPNSILDALQQHCDLGIHSGLVSAKMATMIDAGIFTGAKKTRDKHQHVAGIVLGDQNLHRWAGDNPALVLKPVSYTHDVRVLSSIDNLVSINAALEVDLLGQANAEMLDGHQLSATGGLVDFARGARMARHGRSILTLPATALQGQASRIKSHLGADAVITLSRADIDYVVTEFGVARLRDASVELRARQVIDIAAPQFRDALFAEWAKRV
jgi:4-hydroxybutyrate CoA-transferase